MLDIQIKNGDNWISCDYNNINISLNNSIVNLQNPIKYKTEFSKTLELPLTVDNKRAFGFTDRLDSIMTTKLSIAKPIPCRVFNDGNLIFEGRLQVNNVDLAEEKITGNLYGETNSWYTKLAGVNFTNGLANPLPDEYILDRNTVRSSWNRPAGSRNQTFALPGEAGYNVHDFIGWAPTINGELNNFNSKSCVTTISDVAKIIYVWESFGLSDNSLSTANAMLEIPSERQMIQYRSYNQKPYFYMDRLCELLKKYCNEQEDLPRLELDADWFNNSNILYKNVVYLLPNLVSETEETATVLNTTSIGVGVGTTKSFDAQTNTAGARKLNYGKYDLTESGADPDNLIDPVNDMINGNGTTLKVTLNLNFADTVWKTKAYWSALSWERTPLWPDPKVKPGVAINYVVWLEDTNGIMVTDSKKTARTLSTNTNYTVSISRDTSTENIIDTYTWIVPGFNYTYVFDLPAALNEQYVVKAAIEYTVQEVDVIYPNGGTTTMLWRQATAYNYYDSILQGSNDYFMQYTRGRYTINSTRTNITGGNMKYYESTRSGRKLRIEDIWKNENENSPFKVFVKYCKMMGLVFDYDLRNNKLRVVAREKFFNESYNRGIEDWTDKIDYSKNISFKPIGWENKFVTLNYENTGADRIKDFNERYGYTYGSKRIETSYEYNEDNKDLLDGNDKIKASAEMSEYLYSLWDVYKTATDPTYTPQAKLMNEAFIINRKENQTADTENCFFFRTNTNGQWDTQIHQVPRAGSQQSIPSRVYITDDSREEMRNNTYCYQQPWVNMDSDAAKAVYTNARPVFTKYYAGYNLLFSQPTEDYFNPAAVQRNNNDLYNQRWKNFIEETYNEQNKVLTCNVWMTPSMYNNIKQGKFVIIDGVLYLINKIVDYNPASPETTTQCEFVQVNDINKYISNIL